MDVKAFQDYIESLCVSHIDLRHSINGNVAFSRIMTEEEIQSYLSAGGTYIVIMENVSARPVGQIEQNLFRQSWAISFYGNASRLNLASPSQNISEVVKKSFDIMMQFIAKMKKDWYDDDCSSLKGIDFNMSYRIVQDMELIDHFGWELTVQQIITAPNYDATKWS